MAEEAAKKTGQTTVSIEEQKDEKEEKGIKPNAGNGGETDNRAVAAEILALRAERAQLLGYPDFAVFKLEPEMAKTPAAVRDLLMRVWQPARAKALSDTAVLEAMLVSDGLPAPLETGSAPKSSTLVSHGCGISS